MMNCLLCEIKLRKNNKAKYCVECRINISENGNPEVEEKGKLSGFD